MLMGVDPMHFGVDVVVQPGDRHADAAVEICLFVACGIPKCRGRGGTGDPAFVGAGDRGAVGVELWRR